MHLCSTRGCKIAGCQIGVPNFNSSVPYAPELSLEQVLQVLLYILSDLEKEAQIAPIDQDPINILSPIKISNNNLSLLLCLVKKVCRRLSWYFLGASNFDLWFAKMNIISFESTNCCLLTKENSSTSISSLVKLPLFALVKLKIIVSICQCWGWPSSLLCRLDNGDPYWVFTCVYRKVSKVGPSEATEKWRAKTQN